MEACVRYRKNIAKKVQKRNDTPSSRSLAYESFSEDDIEEAGAEVSVKVTVCGLCNKHYCAVVRVSPDDGASMPDSTCTHARSPPLLFPLSFSPCSGVVRRL